MTVKADGARGAGAAPGNSRSAIVPAAPIYENPRFREEGEVCTYVRHGVLIYDVPCGVLSYVFTFCRDTRRPDVYTSTLQSLGKYTAVNVSSSTTLEVRV